MEQLTPEQLDDWVPLTQTVLGRHVGRDNAISWHAIAKNIEVEAGVMEVLLPEIKALMFFLRTKRLVWGLCASAKGYYIAANMTELEDFYNLCRQEWLDIKEYTDALAHDIADGMPEAAPEQAELL